METKIEKKLNIWKLLAKEDLDLVNELEKMTPEQAEDAFYRELSFGTGGLRGVLGAGTNRMNIYTVRKATQGLANYLRAEFVNENHKLASVAIGYDSRIKSQVFAKEAARVLATNGIHVYLYKQLSPVPAVSFATRHLKCDAGIMITASHNPSKYNGYKVYGNDGCQITSLAAEKITKAIDLVDPFKVVAKDLERLLKYECIEYISDDVLTDFIETVKKESVVGGLDIDRNVSIVYSPLNGTGLVPVTRILKETGFNKVKVVEEQRNPDGNFPTCPFPNPEIREAMALGMEYAKKYNADLLLATDPDCDRVGIAVKDGEEYKLLNGNQTGILLLNYICEVRKLNKTMPEEPYVVKTIVSTDMADNVAKFYGVKMHSVLTGFKYIGDMIASLEKVGKESSYIFGFEESYGYLSGTYVRDKDAVNASFLICEMFAYYKTRGISLLEKLNELYKQFGYYLTTLDNFVFEGSVGFSKMQEIMSSFRKKIDSIGGYKIAKIFDYLDGIDGLPKSDVIKFYLENGSTVTIRPSGTEPKLKMYYSIRAKDEIEANKIYKKIFESLEAKFN